MFPLERYEVILNAVKQNNFVTIKDLQELTKSSLATLRRDINYLHNEGKIKKTTGGVSFIESGYLNSNLFIYNKRAAIHNDEKVSIGKATQDFINDGDVIFLYSGTTVSEVSKHIDNEKHLTVITNGIDTLSVLRNKPNIEVILLGGVVNYPQNLVTGPLVEKLLEELHPSKMITGAGGITEENGVTNFDFTNFLSYKRVIEEVDELIVVADHSKFGKTVLIRSFPFDRIDTIITDEGISPQFIDFFKKYKINYVIAP